MNKASLPVAVIGAGPIGLAAAAHLLERGETPIVFESGAEVGANIQGWSHVRMFSPWGFTVDAATVRLLEKHNWQMPPADELPTGGALRDHYLVPFANLPEVRPHIHLNARVIGVSRHNIDKMKDAGRDTAPFTLHVAYADNSERMIQARAVIDASGTWHNPNPLGAGGLPALGEKRLNNHIAYGIPDVYGTQRARYAGKRVLVVGSGHSAINALLALADLQQEVPDTHIVWALRGTNIQRVLGGGENDALPARGALGIRIKALVDAGKVEILAPFQLREVASATGGQTVEVVGDSCDGEKRFNIDQVIAATGARPDLNMLRELRLAIDPSLESVSTLAPVIDPNLHSCGTVPPHGEAELRHPEKDFYIVGMKSYGRAPTFLLATGYEQVRSVVAGLAGDWDAAREVQLNLPETGVCSTDFLDDGSGGCCGVTPAAQTTIGLADISVANGVISFKP